MHASRSTSTPPPPSRKRVARACNYCRRKRLRCTPGPGPCMNCRLYRVDCTFERDVGSNTTSASSTTKSVNRAISGPNTGDVDLSESPRSRPSAGVSKEPVIPTQYSSLLTPDLSEFEMPTNPSLPDVYQDAAFIQNPNFWVPEAYLLSTMDMVFPETPDASDLTSLGHAPLTWEPPQSESTMTDLSLSSNSYRPAISVGIGSSGTPAVAEGAFPPSSCQRLSSEPRQGLFLRKGKSDTKFLGLHSTGGVVLTSLKKSLKEPIDILGFDTLGYLVKGMNSDEAPLSIDRQIEFPEMGGTSIVQSCIKGYFQHIHLRYPIIDANTDAQFEIEDRGTWTAKSVTQQSIFCLLVAIGALSSHEYPGGIKAALDLARHYQQQAWSVVGSILACPYTDSVRVLILHTIYLLHIGKTGMAWTISGMAVRVAQSLGLHRHDPDDLGLTKEQRSLRSRIWWVAYTLDAFCSLLEGRPPAASNAQISTPISRLLPTECSESTFVTPAQDIYLWHTRLGQIANKFCTSLSQKGSSETRLQTYAEVDRDLLNLRESIPMDFRPEQEILAKGNLHQAVAWIHFEYFNLVRALHWASADLFYFDETLNQFVNPRLRASDSICVSAARNLVRTLTVVTKNAGAKESVFFSFPIKCCVAAAAALFRNIFSEKEHFSARMDLEYLRFATQYANNALDAGYSEAKMQPLLSKLIETAEQKLLSA